jgi:Uma2 family endonuclease
MTAILDYQITWQKLPEDFILPDDPVDNINQPLLAVALSDGLDVADNALITTNYGLCAMVNEKFVVKAPDWAYIAKITVPRDEIIRSYTPNLQGEKPLIVMEFLSETEGGEYSTKPTYPPGKWFFYEQILQVPNYVIFDPNQGVIEVYQLNKSGNYQLQTPDENGRYWIPELNLYLGIWEGTRQKRNGLWLRWWNHDNQLLLWSAELAIQDKQRAETEKQRADKLEAQLRALGYIPE